MQSSRSPQMPVPYSLLLRYLRHRQLDHRSHLAVLRSERPQSVKVYLQLRMRLEQRAQHSHRLNDRECEDHVYCTYEFPGKNFESNPSSRIGVTYSSINGNAFGGYGEVVMGTKGTLILEGEQVAMLYAGGPATSVKVTKDKKGPAPTTRKAAVAAGGPISKGYTEELEHFAYCIRNPDPSHMPRCSPKVARGDATFCVVLANSIST